MCQFFCKVCQPKVEVTLKYFESIQEKQNSIALKVQDIKVNLSKSVADLSSRLKHLNKQIKNHPTSSQPATSHGKGASTLVESPQNTIINQLPIVMLKCSNLHHEAKVCI